MAKDERVGMSQLIGYDMVGPNELNDGDEVCFSRDTWPRGDAITDILSMSDLGGDVGPVVMVVVYGIVEGEPRLIDESESQTRWEVNVYLSSIVLIHVGGLTHTVDLEVKYGSMETVKFIFGFDETLMRVHHTGSAT